MTPAKRGTVGGRETDPNTEATSRPSKDAHDAGADERGDRGYTEAPGGGITDLDGKPLSLGDPAPEPE